MLLVHKIHSPGCLYVFDLSMGIAEGNETAVFCIAAVAG